MRKALILIALAIVVFEIICGSIAIAEPQTVWAFQGDVAFFEEGGKVGLINSEGEILAPAIYDNGSVFDDYGLAKVYLDDKIGCINREGKLIIPLTMCDFIGTGTIGAGYFTDDDVLQYGLLNTRFGHCGFYTLDGRAIGTRTWDSTYGFFHGSAFVKASNKWNLIDLAGNLLSDVWWDKVSVNGSTGGGTIIKGNSIYEINAQGVILREDMVNEQGEEHLVALYDKNGVSIDFSAWEDMKAFSEGVWAVQKQGMWGLVDINGTTIQKPTWKSVTPVKPANINNLTNRPRNRAIFGVDAPGSSGETMYGWLDQYGNIVLAAEWTAFRGVTETRYIAEKKENEQEHGYILDDKGVVVAEVPKWFQRWYLEDENIYYRTTGTDGVEQWGYMTLAGEILCMISTKEYDYDNSGTGSGFGSGMLAVQKKTKNGKIEMEGYMDVNGHFIGSKDWQETGVFSQGLAFVKTKEGFIIIDKRGQEITEPKPWDEVGKFLLIGGQRVCRVVSKGKEAYINDRGELICGFQ